MQNYTNLFQQFIDHTNEKEAIKTELSKLFRNQKFDSLLDIGCGTGEILEPIISNFKKLLLIDIEDRLKHEIKNNPKTQFFKKNFLEFETDKKFDIILAAYVLWEIPYLKWDLFFNKVKKLLKPDGMLIIIDEYSKNEYDNPFFNFNTNLDQYSEYPDLLKYLSDKNIKYKLKKISSQIQAKNELEMYDVLKFFFQKPKQIKFYKENKNRIVNDLKLKCNSIGCQINVGHILIQIQP